MSVLLLVYQGALYIKNLNQANFSWVPVFVVFVFEECKNDMETTNV
jgi:hypothetical protein